MLCFDPHSGEDIVGFWHRRAEKKGKVYDTMDVVSDFIDIWLQTREAEDIDSDELAGVIEGIYQGEGEDRKWMVVYLKPEELRDYIKYYVHSDRSSDDSGEEKDGENRPMMADYDHKLSAEYVKLIKEGYDSPPIIVSGAEDEETDPPVRGLYLIDGRHRIYAACDADVKKITAYIPVEYFTYLKEAKL